MLRGTAKCPYSYQSYLNSGQQSRLYLREKFARRSNLHEHASLGEDSKRERRMRMHSPGEFIGTNKAAF